MAGLQIQSILILILINIPIVGYAKIRGTSLFKKLVMYLFIGGFFIWSGLGICYDSVSDWYFIEYFLFAIGFVFCFSYSHDKAFKREKRCNKMIFRNNMLWTSLILFWGFMIIKIISTGAYKNFFSISLSLNDIFTRNTSSGFLYIVGLVIICFRPIYYTFLYQKVATPIIMLLLLLEFYISVIFEGYVGRSGLITEALFLLLVYITVSAYRKNNDRHLQDFNNEVVDKNKVFSKYMRVLAILLVCAIVGMPILYWYQSFRLGVTGRGLSSISDSLNSVLQIELAFPKYFEKCGEMHQFGEFLKYWVYTFTLPIPKQIFGIQSYALNYTYSTAISGLQIGDMGFAVYLPGLLGEGILLYGNYFSFVHGMFLGLVLGYILGIYSKYPSMQIWLLYLCYHLLLMCRGGSQGAMSTFINGSIVVFLMGALDKYTIKFGEKELF